MRLPSLRALGDTGRFAFSSAPSSTSSVRVRVAREGIGLRAAAACAALGVALLASGQAAAEGQPTAAPVPAPASPPDLSRFAQGRALKSNVVPPGKTERYGRAEILVNAPLEEVRREITAYNAYRELAPDKFNRSRVIAKENNETDVYMQVPIMGGIVVLWQVMRFGPVTPVSKDVERLEGRYVRGNLRASNVLYEVTRVDARRTILRMDLLVMPNMAVPQAAVDEELRDAAATATEGMRDRAERRSRAPSEVASAAPAPAAPPK